MEPHAGKVVVFAAGHHGTGVIGLPLTLDREPRVVGVDPLSKFTPLRNLKVKTLASGDMRQRTGRRMAAEGPDAISHGGLRQC